MNRRYFLRTFTATAVALTAGVRLADAGPDWLLTMSSAPLSPEAHAEFTRLLAECQPMNREFWPEDEAPQQRWKCLLSPAPGSAAPPRWGWSNIRFNDLKAGHVHRTFMNGEWREAYRVDEVVDAETLICTPLRLT